MKRPAALFLVFVFLLYSLFSCSAIKKVHPLCREVLSAMASSEIGLPAGKYYSSSAPKGDTEYLSDTLIASLFGNGSLPEVTKDWIDCALFLSLNQSPCEFAVILCSSRDAAEDTAMIFHSRLAAIKITKIASEYAEMIANASITITENYAIFIISTDPEAALKSAKKVIKSRFSNYKSVVTQ